MKVLVSFEDGLWHAQGVEYDIGASGPSPEVAIEKFQVIWKVELALAIEQGLSEGPLLPTYPEGFDFTDLASGPSGPINSPLDKLGTGPGKFLVEAVL
jgi:hypothetical protein